MSREDRSRLIELAKEMLLGNEAAADKTTRDLLLLYDEAAYQVENQMAALVGRFADQNNLTPQMAQQLLSGKENSQWRQSLEKYLEQLPAEGQGSKLELELNTLAMKSRITRQEQLLGNMYRNVADMAGIGSSQLEDALAGLYRTNYQQGLFSVQKSIRLGFNIAKIDEAHLRQVLDYPWQIKKFSANLWGKADVIAAHLRRELTLGFMKGSSVQEMARQINGVFDAGRYAAERLVRTECKYFANQGELAGYRENGIDEYRFIGGTEGSHNCNCAEENGKVYKITEAKAGINYPPLHPNCLCIVVANFSRSMFTERTGVVPLAENVKFQEWAQKYSG